MRMTSVRPNPALPRAYANTLTHQGRYSQTVVHFRQASHYSSLSWRRLAIAPHEGDVVTISCSVRLSAIPSVTILKIVGNRRPL